MTLSPEVKDLYLEKSESVIQFPEWILCRKTVQYFREQSSRCAIVEIAGRDSVAAAIKAVGERGYTDLLPTYAFTGTECGSLQRVEEAVHRLSDRLPVITIHDLLVMGSSRFWQALNGRFIAELIARFGCYTPCIGCHLYLHAVRIPLAVSLGGVAVISGERESHDGNVKANQSAEAVKRYQALSSSFGIPLLLPLRKIASGAEVENIIGSAWKEGREQLGCVLSGNYRMLNGGVGVTTDQAAAYLDTFAVPCARKMISAYLEGRVPDFMEIATAVLRK